MTEKQQQRKARFKEVFALLNLDRQLVANELGYKKGYLNQILSADKNLSDAAALKFTKWCKIVNEEWLLEGRGEMLNQPDVVKGYQIEEGRPRTEEDLEKDIKDDPLFGGLKERLADYEARISALESRIDAMERDAKVGYGGAG